MNMNKIKRPTSLAEIATENIRNSIIENKFLLGQPLSEAALAVSMGISKTPVREAFAKLQIEGLVVIVPQSGTYVFRMTTKDLRELLDLRYVLEVAALENALKNNADGLISKIKEITNNMKLMIVGNDIENYIKLDYRFHKCFFDFCENSYFTEAYKLISSKIRALQNRIAIKERDRSSSLKEHEDICTFLQERNDKRAFIELRGHFDRTIKSYDDCKSEIEVFGQ